MDDKRTIIKEWFTIPEPKFKPGMLVFGSLLVIIGLILIATKSAVAIILCIALGSLFIYLPINSYNKQKKKYNGRASDTQMDQWREEDLRELERKALEKLGIDKSELVGETVTIIGIRWWDLAGSNFYWRKGRDNIHRFTPINTTIINFTQNQLLTYSCLFDFTTGNVLGVGTDEYFYKDIVSVTTKTESKQYAPWPGQTQPTVINSSESFTLTTSGGTSVSVFLRDSSWQIGDFPISLAEKSIQVVRKMLREKKSA